MRLIVWINLWKNEYPRVKHYIANGKKKLKTAFIGNYDAIKRDTDLSI